MKFGGLLCLRTQLIMNEHKGKMKSENSPFWRFLPVILNEYETWKRMSWERLMEMRNRSLDLYDNAKGNTKPWEEWLQGENNEFDIPSMPFQDLLHKELIC